MYKTTLKVLDFFWETITKDFKGHSFFSAYDLIEEKENYEDNIISTTFPLDKNHLLREGKWKVILTQFHPVETVTENLTIEELARIHCTMNNRHHVYIESLDFDDENKILKIGSGS